MKRGLAWLFTIVMLSGVCGCAGTEKQAKESMVAGAGSTLEEVQEETAMDSVTTGDDAGQSGTIAGADNTAEKNADAATEEVPEYFDTYSSLAELAENFGFRLGAVIGSKEMADEEYKDMLAWHFNSLTASNEMKAYSLLDQRASQENPDGMPVMNYEKADEILTFARDNGIAVRGHTLVWDAYMTDWFFREGYTNAGEYVDAETMKARLQYYIEEVITHFEVNFPGVVYCWDVVNEAVGDSTADCEEGDDRHIRKYRNGQENPFYTHIGPDYVELAFLYARDTVEKLQEENPGVDIKLFYNDYNTFYEEKRDAVCALLASINSYAQDEAGNDRKLCDGIGMQSYIGGYGKQAGCMNESDLDKIEEAILLYASMGVEVQATELAVRNYENDEYEMEKHAAFYRSLFEVYIRVNEGESKPLTGVTIWGLCDNPFLLEKEYAYKMNGPYCGLFDHKYNVKESFKNVYELMGEAAK